MKILSILMSVILYLLPVNTNQQEGKQQEKQYPAYFTISKWERILTGIKSSNQLSAVEANELAQTITNQINQQIAYDKKVADSLSKVKTKKP